MTEQIKKEAEELVECPYCGGSGYCIDYVAECCRNPNQDGSCCNNPIPEPVQIECYNCQTTGEVPLHPTKTIHTN